MARLRRRWSGCEADGNRRGRGKIIRTNGLLQEAGSIIWNEGTTIGYIRDASPLAAEANFVRDVDYCSAVFLLCRTDLVLELGGFDEAFAPAYFEDADLCVRMIGEGCRIVYDPRSAVHHLEFGSASTSEVAMALMRRGKRIFKRRHKAFLDTRPDFAPSNKALSRRGSRARNRLCFCGGHGAAAAPGLRLRALQRMVHAIVAAGYDVHVLSHERRAV